MGISRRYVLRLGKACLAASAIRLNAWADDAVSGDPLLSMTWQQWIPLVGSGFKTQTASGKSSWLTLGAVNDMTPNISGATRVSSFWPTKPLVETFSLKFDGAGEELPQGTYDFENGTLGRIRLFIVPGAQQSYTAIVSHLTGPLPSNHSIPRGRTMKAPALAGAENLPR